MIILHAGIRPLGPGGGWSGLLLWGEQPASRRGKRKLHASSPANGPPAARHPYAAGPEALVSALHNAIGGNDGVADADHAILDAVHPEAVVAWLPTCAGMPVPSSPMLADAFESGAADGPGGAPSARPHDLAPVLAPWTIAVLPLPPERAVELLCCIGDRQMLAPGVVVGKDLTFWAQALRFAAGLVARQRYLPGLVADAPEDGTASLTEDRPAVYRAYWEPILAGADGDHLFRLARMMPPVARALSEPGSSSPPDMPAVESLRRFTGNMVDYLVRLSLNPTATRDPRTFDSLHDHWLYALRAPDGRMEGDVAQIARLAAEIREWRRPVAVATSSPFRLCFRLEEPEQEPEEDPDISPDRVVGVGTGGEPGTTLAASGSWFVRYLLQAVDDPSLLIPVPEALDGRKKRAGAPARVDASVREYVLSSLGQCAGLCPQIAASLKAGLPVGYELDATGAHGFLTQGAMALEQAGFGVMFPAWWSRKGTKLRLSARAHVKSPSMRAAGGLSLDSIVDVDWQVALGDQVLPHAELQALAKIKAPLVKVRGQWVQVNAEDISTALAFWRNKGVGKTARTVTARDVVRMALGAGGPPGGREGGMVFEGVSATGWIAEILDSLGGKVSYEEIPVPVGFVGSLRPYQVRGYSWLSYLRQWGLGGYLADDMGLGKTIQTLALIQRDWEAAGGVSAGCANSAASVEYADPGASADGAPSPAIRPVLLVCPTSVVNNWQKEAARFVPGVPVMVHHGASRERDAAFVKAAERHAIVITSYPILQRDVDLLLKVNWAGVVLDEAQNVKNPETKQSQAARALPADYRIALTGTPVENSVGDLWSVMEFLNPGFLGTREQFKREFFIPIQASGDLEASRRLKRITRPFILRRLKTDRTIIADLPDKMEAKVYCTLTREQASLYAAVVREAEEAIADVEEIRRKGLILATLSKLKQVCNHPAHFLGDNSAIPGRSGKLSRLTEMLEEIVALGDRTLVFTQFAEMGEILKRHLQETFGREVLFLHGGVPKAQRDRMVERFQAGGDRLDGPAVFILSVKAGGTGLNLTAANHVFHFDRWWNPAVENQATDRAFRIGQTRNVQVHKFICAGTLEEKIDALLERKRAVADEVIGAGEGWLTKLSNQELKEIFALRNEAVGE
jgi:superfamily II DNA or RNA helicase